MRRAFIPFLLLLSGIVIGIWGMLGVAVLLAIGYYLICLVRPDAGLAWSFLFLPLAVPQLDLAGLNLHPFELFVWPATLLALTMTLRNRSGPMNPRMLVPMVPILILGGYLGVMSLLFWGDRTPLELRMWGGAIVFGLTCYLRAGSRDFQKHAVRALSTSAALLLGVGLVQHFFGVPGFLGISEPRDLIRLLVFHDTSPVRLANLTFDHFNSAGAYTALLTSVLFALALTRNGAVKWAGFVAAALALYLTYSRGAAIGALAALLTVIALVGSARLRIATAVATTLALIAGGILILPTVLASRYTATLSLGTRALIWQAYFQAWRSSPVFGLGPGNGFAMVQFLSPYGAEYGAHNNFLYLAADFGVVGILVVMGCLGSVALRCWRMPRARRATSPFVVAATAALIALVVHSLFDDTLVVFSYRAALLGIIGIASHQFLAPSPGQTRPDSGQSPSDLSR